MSCATCGHDKSEHEEDIHHGMAVEVVPACLECIHEIDGEGPKNYEPAFHVWAGRVSD